MPIFEVKCDTADCPDRGRIRETILPRYETPNPLCPSCQMPTHRIPSLCHAIWMGTLDKYSPPGQQMYAAKDGGHVAYRTRSSRMVDGSPEPVIIRTRQDQREYCRAEGLTMPDELPQNIEWGKDGQSASSQGLPGCWASVNSDFLEAERAKPLPPEAPATASVTERSEGME